MGCWRQWWREVETSQVVAAMWNRSLKVAFLCFTFFFSSVGSVTTTRSCTNLVFTKQVRQMRFQIQGYLSSQIFTRCIPPEIWTFDLRQSDFFPLTRDFVRVKASTFYRLGIEGRNLATKTSGGLIISEQWDFPSATSRLILFSYRFVLSWVLSVHFDESGHFGQLPDHFW